MTIGPRTSIGDRQHRITLENPSGQPVPEPSGEGGFTQGYADLSPSAVYARITPATVSDLERLAAGTVIASASHVVSMPYHPDVNTTTRIHFRGRTFYVQGVINVDEMNVETIALVNEQVT